jgi:hypothetical protein
LTALNGLTNQVQFFAVGTSGTDFAISSATDTHTFNLPTASATNRGALSSADWTTFNNKTSNLGTVTSVGLSSATSGVTIGSSPITTSGTITLAIATASGSQNGLLSSTDWTTFNGKQNALTNPVTGTGTTNYLPKFTGSTTIGNSNLINDASGNLGLGVTPSAWASDFRAMQIGLGTSLYNNSNTNGTFLGSNLFFNGSNNIYLGTGTATAYAQSLGTHAWYNAPSGTAGNAISFTQAMTLTSGGNLLVGTTTDAGFKLQVNGEGRFYQPATTSTAYLRVENNRARNAAIRLTTTVGDYYLGVGIGADVNQFQIFDGIAGETRLTIASTGAATFSSFVNATNLRVFKSSFRGGLFAYNDVFGSGSDHSITVFADSGIDNGNIYFCPNGSSTRAMTINTSGNVLIGTGTNGASKLRIVGLPTSAVGLSSGDVYNLAGTLMIA